EAQAISARPGSAGGTPKDSVIPVDSMTANARRVHEFRLRISKESERCVRMIDIANAAGYRDRTMLQWFLREGPRLTKTARENFERVLNYDKAEFWRCVDAFRQRHPL